MQNSIQEFTIGFFDSSGVYSIYVKQNDNARLLKFHIDDEGQDYTELLSSDALHVLVHETLPDGTVLPDVEVPSEYVDAGNSTVTVPVTDDMITQAGTALCELCFIVVEGDEAKVLSTTQFKLIIAQNLGGAPSSEEEREWFDTWTELYIHLSILEHTMETDEATRQANEETRISNENTRIDNENTRITAENARISNENTRIDNENTRITAENARISNETERQTAEQERQAAEEIRESKVQEQVDEAHMWATGTLDPTDHPSADNSAKAWAEKARVFSRIFNGTKAEWDALTSAEKAGFLTVVLIDY